MVNGEQQEGLKEYGYYLRGLAQIAVGEGKRNS